MKRIFAQAACKTDRKLTIRDGLVDNIEREKPIERRLSLQWRVRRESGATSEVTTN